MTLYEYKDLDEVEALEAIWEHGKLMGIMKRKFQMKNTKLPD